MKLLQCLLLHCMSFLITSQQLETPFFLQTVQLTWRSIDLHRVSSYSTTLRGTTQGRGNYSMQLGCYSEVPKSEQEKIAGKKK